METTNKMSKAEKLISLEKFLSHNYGVSLDAFYVVTIREYEIALQGKYDSNLVRNVNMTEIEGYDIPKFSIEDSGYVRTDFYVMDVKIEIVLT